MVRGAVWFRSDLRLDDNPAFDIFTKAEYSKPIVDLKLSRQRAIDIFKNNKTNTNV